MGLVPEGTFRNKSGRLRAMRRHEAVDPITLDLLFDPQTSGGLLVALPKAVADEAIAALRQAGVDAVQVGESGGPPGAVELVV